MSANETYYVRACRDHFHVAYTDADGETADVIPDGAIGDRFPTREEAALFAARMNGELVTRAPAGGGAREGEVPTSRMSASSALGREQADRAGSHASDRMTPQAAIGSDAAQSPSAPSAPPRPSVEPVLSPEGEREVEQVMAKFAATFWCAATHRHGPMPDKWEDAKAAVRALVAQREEWQRHAQTDHEDCVRLLNERRDLVEETKHLARELDRVEAEEVRTLGACCEVGWTPLVGSGALAARIREQAALVARLADGLRGLQARTGGFAHGSWEAQLNGTINDLLASLDGGATEEKR